jgi:hypothetical protein
MIKPITVWSAIALLAVSFQASVAFGADGHHFGKTEVRHRSGGDPSTSHLKLRRHDKLYGPHTPVHPGNHHSRSGRRGHKGGAHSAPIPSGWNRVNNNY